MILRRSQLIFVGAYLAIITVVGALGYLWIEGWSWKDAMYMAVITVTAVGYHEVHPLSDAGRYWTTFVLACGLTGLGMWFAIVTAALVRMDLGEYGQIRTLKRLKRMKDHVIVCGGGKMGLQVAQELHSAGQEFVVIERDPEALEELRALSSEIIVLDEDATNDRALTMAGVERASGLVACLSDDADNLYVCLSAHHLNAKVAVVVRAEGSAAIEKMYRAGADHVVSPNVTGAMWVATVLVRPSVAALLDVATPGRERKRRLDHATVGEGSRLAGKTLAEARLPHHTGLVVLAIQRRGSSSDEIDFNPGAETELQAGDQVIALGEDHQIRKLRQYLGD